MRRNLSEIVNPSFSPDEPPAGGGPAAKPAEQKPTDVTLEAETYNALLDRLAELEARDQLPLRRERAASTGDDLEDLALEGRGRREQLQEREPASPTEEIDYDKLTNKQMMDLIVSAVNSGQPARRLQQLEVAVQEVKVEAELNQCISRHKDFMLYADEVKKLGMENPTLSLEKAYKLAKADDPERAMRLEKRDDKTGERKLTTTEKLLHLPPRAVHGEKPSVAASATQEAVRKKGETLKDSASRAWDTVMGNKEGA